MEIHRDIVMQKKKYRCNKGKEDSVVKKIFLYLSDGESQVCC